MALIQSFLWQYGLRANAATGNNQNIENRCGEPFRLSMAIIDESKPDCKMEVGVNTLYYGDCLTIMQQMAEESIDLIYLDPPFNSKRNYHTIYKDHTGNPLPEQVEAFCDQWLLDSARKEAIEKLQQTMIESRIGIDHHSAELVHTLVDKLQDTQPGLAAYLSYMTERLIWMKKILKPTGSIYLHCDPTASHYIKIIMDAIFGHKHFRNEIIWSYRRWPAKSQNFQRMHDVILRYTKDIRSATWNQLYEPLAPSTLKAFGRKRQVADFSTGRRLPRQLKVDSPGAPMRDVWNIGIIAPSSKERMGYPTQKPLKLLERIIKASSNEGDLVFDPFCGCATTIEAAHRLGRRWIGIDVAIHAIKRVAKVRLEQRLGLSGKQGHFRIQGIPTNYEGARDLWRRDPYHFQQWCVEEVNGFVTSRRTADGGIDGRIYFEMNDVKKLQNMILEVKGGASVPVAHLRALIGALDISDAKMAGLIVMEDLGERKRRNFQNEMDRVGAIEINGQPYPKVQLLTVSEILNGARFKTPNVRGRTESGYPSILLPEA